MLGRYARNRREGVERFRMKISCLHPTCRPEKAIATHYKWIDLAKEPQDIEYIFAFDNTPEANEVIEKNIEWIKYVMLPHRLGCVNKLNEAAKYSSGNILLMASDDVIPQKEWDTALINACDWSKEVCLDINEGRESLEVEPHRQRLLKGIILSRARYLKQSYILHPDFYHTWADDHYSFNAYKDGVVIKAKNILFEHFNPCYGKGEVDVHYSRIYCEQQDKYGRDKFEELTGTKADH